MAEQITSVSVSGTNNSMNAWRRIGLWFGSLLLGVMLFSLLYGLFTSQVDAFFLIARITMMLALPVWFLYLPFVLAIKDAEGRRMWTVLVSGTLIGPAYLGLWGLVLQLKGGDAHEIWIGNGIDGGYGPDMISALVVGLLTTGFYVIGLKVACRRQVSARGVAPRRDIS